MRFDPIASWAQRQPERLAIRQRRPVPLRWSVAAFDQQIDHAATWLRDHGVIEGDRVALLAGNRVEGLLLAFASWRLGATFVPLNWRLSATELARIVAHAAPRVWIADASHASLADDAWRASRASIPCAPMGLPELTIPVDDDGVRMSGHVPLRAEVGGDGYEAIAMLLYTSGSTGHPKAVRISHHQLQANAEITAAGWTLQPDDRALVATPLFHTAGWHAFTTPVLAAGGAIVLDGDFQADHLMETLLEEAVTRLFVVPTQLLMVQRTAAWGMPLPALRQWLVGGAPCPRPARDAALQAGYPLFEAYGLTEFGPNCFVLPADARDLPSGTVGRALPGIQARVVAPDGHACTPDTVGSLEFRGAPCCAGYAGDPDASSALLTADGWIRTGDLASIDSTGMVRIAGRTKELFISGGEHVHPGEVERTLREYPGVADVVVVAVPDPWWGEVGCAVVQLTEPLGVQGGDQEAFRHFLHFMRGRLASYKIPRLLWPVPTFPLLGSGKIDRVRVAELARAALVGEDSSMLVISHEAGRT